MYRTVSLYDKYMVYTYNYNIYTHLSLDLLVSGRLQGSYFFLDLLVVSIDVALIFVELFQGEETNESGFRSARFLRTAARTEEKEAVFFENMEHCREVYVLYTFNLAVLLYIYIYIIYRIYIIHYIYTKICINIYIYIYICNFNVWS